MNLKIREIRLRGGRNQRQISYIKSQPLFLAAAGSGTLLHHTWRQDDSNHLNHSIVTSGRPLIVSKYQVFLPTLEITGTL